MRIVAISSFLTKERPKMVVSFMDAENKRTLIFMENKIEK